MSSELLEESNSRFLTEAKEAVAFVLLELEYMDVPTHTPEPSSHQEISNRQIQGPLSFPTVPCTHCLGCRSLSLRPVLYGSAPWWSL